MGAAIWSCPTGTFARFPLQFVVEFFQNHGLLNLRDRPTWRVVEGGSRTYVDALRSRITGQIRLNTPVLSVRRSLRHVTVRVAGGHAEDFDQVIFACHSDQALRILTDPTSTECQLLSAFPYLKNEAVLHTDDSFLPRCRSAWASWNYRIPREPLAHASVTYWMNQLQHLRSRHQFCVTLNDTAGIDPRKILRRFVYEHPIFTTGRKVAQARHAEVIGVNRTSFCGAYWRNGFHEDGVVSAMAVCEVLERQLAEPEPVREQISIPSKPAAAVVSHECVASPLVARPSRLSLSAVHGLCGPGGTRFTLWPAGAVVVSLAGAGEISKSGPLG
jgi:predicted NAD/FAD-binding protein